MREDLATVQKEDSGGWVLVDRREASSNSTLAKVPCAPKQFSGRFSYSTCTNDFGYATHNERRFQFRLVNVCVCVCVCVYVYIYTYIYV